MLERRGPPCHDSTIVTLAHVHVLVVFRGGNYQKKTKNKKKTFAFPTEKYRKDLPVTVPDILTSGNTQNSSLSLRKVSNVYLSIFFYLSRTEGGSVIFIPGIQCTIITCPAGM